VFLPCFLPFPEKEIRDFIAHSSIIQVFTGTQVHMAASLENSCFWPNLPFKPYQRIPILKETPITLPGFALHFRLLY